MQKLRNEVVNAQRARKAAAASLKVVSRKAAQERLMEKEKNKGPPCAMGLSFKLKKVAWSMLLDGKPISEIEINDMVKPFIFFFNLLFYLPSLLNKHICRYMILTEITKILVLLDLQ